MEDPTLLALQVSANRLAQEFRHDEALAHAERALALDKGDPESQIRMSLTLTYAGKAAAVPYARRAMRLDPNYPASYDLALGMAYYGTGNLKDALAQLEKASKRNPEDAAPLYFLAAANVETGESEKARRVIEQLGELGVGLDPLRGPRLNNPNLKQTPSAIYAMRTFPFRDAVVAQRFGSSLMAAGARAGPTGYTVERHINIMRAQGKMK